MESTRSDCQEAHASAPLLRFAQLQHVHRQRTGCRRVDQMCQQDAGALQPLDDHRPRGIEVRVRQRGAVNNRISIRLCVACDRARASDSSAHEAMSKVCQAVSSAAVISAFRVVPSASVVMPARCKIAESHTLCRFRLLVPMPVSHLTLIRLPPRSSALPT